MHQKCLTLSSDFSRIISQTYIIYRKSERGRLGIKNIDLILLFVRFGFWQEICMAESLCSITEMTENAFLLASPISSFSGA